MSESNTKSDGLGFGTVLFLIFLVLKLTKTIAWSWWWVTLPLWGPLVLVTIIAIVTVLCVAIFGRD